MNKLNEFAARFPQTGIVILGLAEIARILPPANAPIFGDVAFDQRNASVSGSVISDEQFKIPEILNQNGIQAFRQKRPGVIHRNENADLGKIHWIMLPTAARGRACGWGRVS